MTETRKQFADELRVKLADTEAKIMRAFVQAMQPDPDVVRWLAEQAVGVPESHPEFQARLEALFKEEGE